MNKRITIPEPLTAGAKKIRERVTPKRWLQLVTRAQKQADLVRQVRARSAADGISLYEGLRRISAKTPWPSFQYWNGRAGDSEEVCWEAFLDQRMPPKQLAVTEILRACAVTMKRMRPDMDYEEARRELIAQHGDSGAISNSSLRRIWQAAGLLKQKSRDPDVTELHGGTGLALIGAASLETGASIAMARAIQEGAQQKVASQLERALPDEPAGRDEKGRLTAEYNRSTRIGVEPGEPDSRWEPDYKKRTKRDLARQRVLHEKPETLAQKVLAVGAVALITERRGFDGLDGPQGEWLKALSNGVPYKPGTLDKFLSQMGLLDVEDYLWSAHAELSVRHASRWAAACGGAPWLAVVMYIDATQDTYWTRKYALSGKVSSTGRVGPCLGRIAINAGPGIPFLMETYPGTVSLKKELPRLLERVESIIGDDGVRRLTIIDAEMSTAKLLTAFIANPGRAFVTVLKGRSFSSYKASSDWHAFRERDRVREGTMLVQGEGAPTGGLQLRVVEMKRDGRHEQSTFFATSHSSDDLSTAEVVEAYLSRWPNQEHSFRNGRNGLGLDRSHGYSGEKVHHVALDTKIEKAKRQSKRAEEREARAQVAADTVKAGTASATVSRTVQLELASAKKAVKDAKRVLDKLNSTAKLIWERDTARENSVTACSLNMLFLIEFVLREYFGGVKMELRTFVEHFVNLPLTIMTTAGEVKYLVHANPRNPERTEQVRLACEEVTRRGLVRAGRRLVFTVVDRQRKPVKT